MPRVLVVSHGPRLRDNHLWLSAMSLNPQVHLAVPGLGIAGALSLSPTLANRIHPLETRRGPSQTSRWPIGLMALIRDLGVELVHLDDEPWSLACQALTARGIPTVVHGAENVIATAPRLYRVRRIGLRRVLKSLAGFAAWGETALRAERAVGLGPRTPTITLPARPPAPEDFPWRTPRERTGPLRFGFVGRLVHEKGADIAIMAAESASRCVPLELHILGDGPERGQLAAVASQRRAHVRFHPAGGRARVADFIAAMDVIVVPSRATPRWTEQWCRVAVESLMMGKPVLVSDCGELPFTVPNPNWTFREGSAESLAELMVSQAELPWTTESSAAAFEMAQRFHPALLGGQLVGYWKSITGRVTERAL